MRYLWLTIKHKWFVLVAGIRIGAPLWRLIVHDWTKFLPCELPHYNRQFFGDKSTPYSFMRAWLHHQNSNDHHWEYWIPRTGHNRCEPPFEDGEAMLMAPGAYMEMIADWVGASRAYEGRWPTKGDWKWLDENLDKVTLNPITRREVTLGLVYAGYLEVSV